MNSALGMRLSYLLAAEPIDIGAQDPVITGLALDSRKVRPGDCFFACGGTREHGNKYALDAVMRGAAAVITDCDARISLSVPSLALSPLVPRVGAIAARFFGEPSNDLVTIAVTGTNGKTTVAHLCAQALNALGKRCAYVGTLGCGDLSSLASSNGITTPDPITLQAELRRFVNERFDYVAMEASSHALDQARLAGTALDIAIFTGLGHDHLDYHASLDAYAEAKCKLFTHPGLTHAVLNVDDALSAKIIEELAPTTTLWTFSLKPSTSRPRLLALRNLSYANRITTLEVDLDGQTLVVKTQLVGEFNVQNVLATLGALLAAEIPLADACRGIATARPVIGRLESFGGGIETPKIYVDYAHSPDSLARVLKVLRPFAAGRLICVFGCGGNRDTSKRPMMGAIAERLADIIIITDDNPRDESPQAIAAQILSGMTQPHLARVVHARADAIHLALSEASTDDVVLIAGKGHEDTQEVAGIKSEFSDQQVVREWLAGRR